ncbi:MAG: transporter substrate-binding domain-containing protein [Cyanobium sp. LacPavin_0920_WC12_MAG_63_22]|nr:transporter substrate-binding domain-containing protein [Cyanobium sp. LacPavin_0920_WC12_MAG_63_22]
MQRFLTRGWLIQRTFRLRKRRLFLLGVVLLCLAPPAAAQGVLRIGVVDDQAPCSDVVNRSFEGSAVDVWYQVASRADLLHTFVALRKPDEAVRAAARGQVDLVVSCLNITPFRLYEAAFTTPYSDDGLSLLTRREQSSFATIIKNLRASAIIRDSIALLIALGLGFALILWITSREFQHRDIVGDNKRATFYKGWMMLAMGTGIYKMGSAPLSMSIIALNNFVRLVITSIFVAGTTSVVLKVSKPVDISNAKDLRSALEDKIGVVSDSVAQAWLDRSADAFLTAEDQLKMIVPFDSSIAMVASLEQGNVGSVLADSASIATMKRKIIHPNDYQVVGETLYRTPQAFAVGARLDGKTLKKVNVALAQLKFEGEVDRTLKRWQPAHNH